MYTGDNNIASEAVEWTRTNKPADEACTCHPQIPLSGWHVPAAAAEVRQAPGQELQLVLHRDEVTRNLQNTITHKR